jgi:hypothetical protein
MYWLSIWITQPIVQFTRKIELNIAQVRKLKHGKHLGKQLSQIQMQVDLMKGFTKSNREMNSLYVDFNKMAQILAVGHYSNLSGNSY